MSTVRILGIDPGLQCTGFGVIDSQGSQLHYVASGIHYSISTKVTYNEYISIFWGIFTGSWYIYW